MHCTRREGFSLLLTCTPSEGWCISAGLSSALLPTTRWDSAVSAGQVERPEAPNPADLQHNRGSRVTPLHSNRGLPSRAESCAGLAPACTSPDGGTYLSLGRLWSPMSDLNPAICYQCDLGQVLCASFHTCDMRIMTVLMLQD